MQKHGHSSRIKQCAAPVTVGIRSLLPAKMAFSGPLPGEFHRLLTLPYTNRQLSADRDTVTLPVHHLLQYVIILAAVRAVVKGYFNFFPVRLTCEYSSNLI